MYEREDYMKSVQIDEYIAKKLEKDPNSIQISTFGKISFNSNLDGLARSENGKKQLEAISKIPIKSN